MASMVKYLIACSLLVVAASGLREQLLQQILNPSPAACRRSPLLVSLGVCDKYLIQPPVSGGENQGQQEVEAIEQEPTEQEAGEQVEQEAGEPVEQEAGEAVEQEAEEPIEQEAGEPGEQELGEAGAEQEAEFEAEAGAEPMMEARLEGVIGGYSLCGPHLFTCQAVKKCVPKSLVCNGVDNCGDGSDERNCRFQPYRT